MFGPRKKLAVMIRTAEKAGGVDRMFGPRGKLVVMIRIAEKAGERKLNERGEHVHLEPPHKTGIFHKKA